MGTLIGTLKRGTAALQTTITFASLEGPLGRVGYVESKAEIRTSTSVAGSFSVELDEGNYRVEWVAGTVRNVAFIAMPSGAGPHEFEDLITTEPADPVAPDVAAQLAAANAAALLSRVKPYATVTALLAAAATEWTLALTAREQSGDPDQPYLWIRVLLADSPYTWTGDRVRLTGDGLAHAIRIPA